MARFADSPSFMRRYLQDIIMDDALPTPASPLPPTCWETVASCADPDASMFISTAINSFIDGSSGLLTDTTFHERQYGTLRTEFTSRAVISTHYPLYYFEATVHAPNMNGVWVIPGITYSFGGSAIASHGYYEIRLARVLSTHNCKSGDVIGCGVCPRDNAVFFTKNGRCTARQMVDLRRATALRPVLSISAESAATPYGLRVRTRANFGQEPFSFNIFPLSWGLWSARMARFRKTAACLPSEVLATIAALAADTLSTPRDLHIIDKSPWKLRDQMANRSRLSMVCRAWRKICRTPLFSSLFLLRMRHLRSILRIFDHHPWQHHPGSLVHALYVGSDEPVSAHTCKDFAPGMGLVLSSGMMRHAKRVHTIVWNECDAPRPVPPRIQGALPALLRASTPSLTRLRVLHKRFASLSQLVRIISSIHSLREVHLEDIQCDLRPAISPLHAPISLRNLFIQGCALSLEQISALLTLTLPIQARRALYKAAPSAESMGDRLKECDALAAVKIAAILLASYYPSDIGQIGHYWQQMCLSVEHAYEAKTNDFQWILSLQERSGNAQGNNPSREVLRLSVIFRAAECELPATMHQITIDLHNCYKPRPVTHWTEFRQALVALNKSISSLSHCTGFALRMRDYSTWDEPWLPALEKHMRDIDDSVRRSMPHACANGSVRVEHLGTVVIKGKR